MSNPEEKVNREIVPKKSLIYSLVLPGLGQVYNRRWWKVPLVFGAIGGMVYAIDYNSRTYRDLRDALNLKRIDQPHQYSGTSIDNVQSLENLRDRFDKNRQLSYIGLVVVYGLQAIEAFVDGHLINFDMEDDLAKLKIKPHLEMPNPIIGPYLSIQMTLPLHNTKPKYQPTSILSR